MKKQVSPIVTVIVILVVVVIVALLWVYFGNPRTEYFPGRAGMERGDELVEPATPAPAPGGAGNVEPAPGG